MRFICLLLIVVILLGSSVIDSVSSSSSSSSVSSRTTATNEDNKESSDIQQQDQQNQQHHQQQDDVEVVLSFNEIDPALQKLFNQVLQQPKPTTKIQAILKTETTTKRKEEKDYTDIAVAAAPAPAPAKDTTKITTSTVSTSKSSNNDITKEQKNQDVVIDSKQLLPIQITSRTFSKLVSDGNIWVLYFYSINCIHCQEFSSTYNELASFYHSQNINSNSTKQSSKNTNKNKKLIKIGKINGPSERSLVQRFGIYGYPTIFLMDGWSVYVYSGSDRSVQALQNYINGGYKVTKSLSIFDIFSLSSSSSSTSNEGGSHPYNLIGLVQSFGIHSIYLIDDIIQYSTIQFGLSSILTCMILFGTLFIISFFSIVFLAILIPP